MDANVILGGLILTLAMVITGLLAAIVLAAQRSGAPSYAPKAEGTSRRPLTGLLAEHPADCYYHCMSGFRWSNDWENLCGEACGIGMRLPRTSA